MYTVKIFEHFFSSFDEIAYESFFLFFFFNEKYSKYDGLYIWNFFFFVFICSICYFKKMRVLRVSVCVLSEFIFIEESIFSILCNIIDKIINFNW